MPPMPQSYSIFWTSGDGDDGDDGDGGGGGFPRTLESGRSPGPTRPGTKYPVRGIPHFDILTPTATILAVGVTIILAVGVSIKLIEHM